MTRSSADRSFDALSLTALAGAGALTAALYPRLPARVPTHFDAHGLVDGWMDRPIGAWLLPAIALAAWLLVRFGAAILPAGARERLAASPVRVGAFLMVALLLALQLVVLYAALHPGDAMGRPLSLTLGAFWLVLAQVLPRVRRNPLFGLRTAWTLSSDESWARTHRFASVTFSLGGLVALGAALAGAPAVALLAIALSALAPIVFSFVVARRLPPT